MRALILSLFLSAAPAAVLAQDAIDDGVYTLGELQVTARDRTGEALGGAVVSGEMLETFQKITVDQALDLVPGTNGANTGGSRNERLVYVRGFDRFQTTLSVDGVRVFLPADNRIDFGRFLTADLSEIQISKGYVSVIDGPGGLGGAINLVTRKPVAPFEARLDATSFLDAEAGQQAYQVSGLVGGRRGAFYLQASGAYLEREHYTLSDDFTPTALENGGPREHSNARDWRANLKAGWTPNETDEYSLNLSRQEGGKNAPYHVSDTASTRFWDWPYWNLDSISFLSRTRLNDRVTLRSRLYANTFTNALFAYDSAAQTTQSLPRAFRSYYDDEASGGNVQADVEISPSDLLKAAFYVRSDRHRERQDGFIRVGTVNTPYAEPWQTTLESTYSLALENRLAIGADIDLITGVSYDWTDLRKAEEFSVFVTGTTLNQTALTYPLRNNHALNGQAALTWRLSEATRLHASVSSRERFPTLFERFSSRMGAAIPNPDVKPERATNYEIGLDAALTPKVSLKAAVFYSDIKDALIQIPVAVTGFGTVNQTKNAGRGEYYGLEASLTARVTDRIEVGGNYTHIERDLTDPTNAAFRPTGVPDDKLFVYADWQVNDRLSVAPSLEIVSDRWTVTSSSLVAPPVYYRIGDYTLLNLAAEWKVTDAVALAAGARNLLDQDFSLVDGFPEAGRSFYASLRAKF